MANLRAAIDAMRAFADITRVSRVYETAPVGPPQPHYLNAAAAIATELSPHGLLDALLAIEASLGRERRERWGARTIDLDILWIEGVVVHGSRLLVPHPRVYERAFALVPLLEVAPDAPFAPLVDETVRATDLSLL